MKKIVSTFTLVLATVVVLSLGSCNDQYEKSLDMAKKAKCKGEAAKTKLDQNPDDAEAQLELKQAADFIKFHREQSGDEEKFRSDLADYTCP